MIERFWRWRYDYNLREYARLVEYKRQWGGTIGVAELAYIDAQLCTLSCKIQKIYLEHGPYEKDR